MLPIKYSFRLLKKADVKNIRNIYVSKESLSMIENSDSDDKKRAFLKLAGVVGLGAVASLFIPKKAEALIFGSTPASNVVGVKDKNNNKINPAEEDGNLATIAGKDFATQTTLATLAKEEDGNLATIAGKDFATQTTLATLAKESGGNLATIATNTGKFSFDNDSNLKIASTTTISAGNVNLQDTTGTRINPATDDTALYLRKIVKLLEPSSTVDGGNRQRITIDAVGTGVTLPVSQTLNNLNTIASQNQQMFQDPARTSFALGIRNNLTFS